MSKSVMIDGKLFDELVRYHCFGAEYADVNYIRQALEDKVSRMAERERYTKTLLADKETPR